MKRLTYQGTLRFPFGFHTGDGRRLGVVDQPLFREADGQVALSGSSLAGVLRADLERLVRDSAGEAEVCQRAPDCRCLVCRLMGSWAGATRRGDDERAALRASRLHVLGGPALGATATRVRDRVGIDRRTRTAADRRKYDVEVVDGGVVFPFELRLDDAADDERLHLEAVLRRLAAGWLFLGGKSASGLGRAEVASLARCELDLARPQALVEHLLADEPTAGAEVVSLIPAEGEEWAAQWELPGGGPIEGCPPPRGQVRLHLELSFPLGFLVNDPTEGLLAGLDHTFVRNGEGLPVLPGSALRGALRSRAEQILRTLGGSGAACDLNRRGHACHEAVERENQRRREEAHEEALDFAGEVALHCPACRVFGSGRLASAVRLTDFRPLLNATGASLRHEHVAVDRFTGGAAAGAKFNAEVRRGVTLAGELHLDLGPDRLESWGLGLLALVFRDLLLGDVPMGFGTAKGFNEYSARITAIDRFWLRPPAPLDGELGLDAAAGTVRWRPPGGEDLNDPQAAAERAGPFLRERLEAWVDDLHRELARRRTGPAPATLNGAEEAHE
jgi:CRISPR/Cas system CSM-associated protein Csm3 (group 7 of RAMP superfamily)